MELVFVKDGSKYVAEFEATNDFNVHIEKAGSGYLYAQQRTTNNGEYDSIRGASFAPSDSVVDVDFIGSVYPKHIRIVSQVAPTLATITFME
jgi:hypothetical protein